MASTYTIPFNRSPLFDRQLDMVREAIRAGHISGDGQYTRQAEAWLESHFEGSRVLLTTSCTHALEMSAILADIQPGDEVLIPSFTFVSTANAFVLRGAQIRFVDIRPDTLNMDEQKLIDVITPKTSAIVPVHYGGVGCNMDVINQRAKEYGLTVIEDNAHGLFGAYRDRPLGSFGAMATLSFHETKNISCGEGGALIVNNPEYVERAEIIREKGTNRKKFYRGQVDKYTWVDMGSSYVMSDMLAAYLYGALQHADDTQQKRKAIWQRYAEGLAAIAATCGVRLPAIPENCTCAYHLFYLIMPDGESRDGLIKFLGEHGILSVFHYMPLHLSEMGQRFGGRKGLCPVTEDVSSRLVRLPMYYDLTEAQQDEIIKLVVKYLGG